MTQAGPLSLEQGTEATEQLRHALHYQDTKTNPPEKE